jgi:hypothetical protein
MTHDEQRAVKDKERETDRYTNTAAKYTAVVKNQHTREKWADAEKRSVDL